jgi:hypothetical protein
MSYRDRDSFDKERIGFTVLAWVVAIGHAAYYYFLRVPSVIEIRPELTEVGTVTGLTGGRGAVWLWYHYPELGVVYSILLGVVGTLMFVYW